MMRLGMLADKQMEIELTKEMLCDLIKEHKESISEKSKCLWNLFEHLEKFSQANIVGNDGRLTEEAFITLQTIIYDYHQHASRDEISDKIVNRLYHTKQLSDTLPKGQASEGNDIKEEDFAQHVKNVHADLLALSISDDTRTSAMTVIAGILNIITDKDKIADFHFNHFGKTYDLVEDKLPLHTDHHGEANKDAFSKTLSRLVKEFISSYLIAKQAGQQEAFFEKIARGFCLEGRVRDTFAWAAQLDDLKSGHELMATYYKEVESYYAIMHPGKNIDEQSPAVIADIICYRHRNIPCRPDALFPNGEINKENVKSYIIKILAADKPAPTPWFTYFKGIVGLSSSKKNVC